ncbi:stalk domain-containing protein [Clostridium aciditolerans]|uniref:Copper amine oxidase-like N-terminal domain-containing protein n=1 Tax=Clostridium aciditolerans TaxID=339861 RepID=A0A934M567_9CLOT|nr:stalk domain-containing protein [Clostridium aciditolerans]MBI6873298.1 hypothetical protein [Clostridium aciditolerans]
MAFNKLRAKDFIIGFAASSILFTSTQVFAQPLKKQVTAIFDNIKIVVDGKQITPKDSSGNIVEPFRYNGNIYLPVCAVEQTLDKKASWDENTKTIYIDSKPLDAAYQQSISSNTDKNSGNTEDQKPFFDKNKLHNKWGVNLDGNHRKMTGTLYIDKLSSIKTVHLDIYGDEKFIKSYTLKAGEKPIIINEDLTNVKEFSIVSNLRMTSNLNGDQIMKLEMALKDSNSLIKFGDITIE